MIADAALVRAVGNLPGALSDDQIAPHLRQASRRLARWVGATLYAAVEADSGHAAHADVKDAEAYLAVAIGVASWNMAVESVGSEGVAGITQEGNVGDNQYRYLGQQALRELQQDMVRKAEDAARDWLVADYGGGSPGPGISFAYDDDGVVMDDDYPGAGGL